MARNKKGFFKSLSYGTFLDVTCKEATRNALVAVKVACWFYVGEIIGRKSIIGYKTEWQGE